MKFVGILKEHESGPVKVGQTLNALDTPNKSKIDDYEAIASYLQNGAMVISFLHYVQDSVGNPIAPLIFYTDGKWIWPSYLLYYLSKNYSSILPNEFYSDMKSNKFVPPKVEKGKLEEAQRFYRSVYG